MEDPNHTAKASHLISTKQSSFSATKDKAEGRKTHKQPATEGDCSKRPGRPQGRKHSMWWYPWRLQAVIFLTKYWKQSFKNFLVCPTNFERLKKKAWVKYLHAVRKTKLLSFFKHFVDLVELQQGLCHRWSLSFHWHVIQQTEDLLEGYSSQSSDDTGQMKNDGTSKWSGRTEKAFYHWIQRKEFDTWKEQRCYV